MNRNQYRVPLSDIPAFPMFLNDPSKQAWIEDHKITVESDWAGRQSVDLATAWRLKDEFDRDQEFIAEENRQRAEHDAAKGAAQREADAIFDRTFVEVAGRADPMGDDPMMTARLEVMKYLNTLPPDVASGVTLKVWAPIGPGL